MEIVEQNIFEINYNFLGRRYVVSDTYERALKIFTDEYKRSFKNTEDLNVTSLKCLGKALYEKL